MASKATNPLPAMFCWTRFGTEAGESIASILERKELERRANEGTFFWGIGNSVAPGMAELLRHCDQPEVLFSPIKSRPRLADVAPPAVVTWTAAETLDGELIDIPSTVRVTSRSSNGELPSNHYALVCSSAQPLAISDLGRLDFQGLRNLISGNSLGASQVTAVVSRVNGPSPSKAEYPVALRASLVWPYFIRLRNPEWPIDAQAQLAL